MREPDLLREGRDLGHERLRVHLDHDPIGLNRIMVSSLC